MATKTADPLAGVPVAGASPAKPAANVINLAQAKKKRKLTGEDYRNAVKFARGITGYDDTSPIWGKKMVVVLAELLERLDTTNGFINAGDLIEALDSLKDAQTSVTELQKRIATGQVIKAQS